jgi:epsilon-lactone hydrolase
MYRGLLDVEAPERIVVGGQSAGGNLAAALMLRARDEGLPLPAALLLLSPEADLTESGDSFATMLGLDPVLTASLADSIALYAGDHDLTDPYLSPLFGDFTGSPRVCSRQERAISSCRTRSASIAMRSVGVDAELRVFRSHAPWRVLRRARRRRPRPRDVDVRASAPRGVGVPFVRVLGPATGRGRVTR